MLFPDKLHNDPSFKLSTDKNNTRGMGINIPTYSDELTADVTRCRLAIRDRQSLASLRHCLKPVKSPVELRRTVVKTNRSD